MPFYYDCINDPFYKILYQGSLGYKLATEHIALCKFRSSGDTTFSSFNFENS